MPPMNAKSADTRKPKNTKATIKRLMSYLKEDKVKVGLAFVCVLVSSMTNLAGSYMLRPIINNLVADVSAAERISTLAINLVKMASIYAAGVLAAFFQARIMIGVSQRALLKLRGDLFEKLQDLPVRFFDTNNTGDIMSRFTNDVDTIGEMLNSTLVQIFQGIVSLIGTLILMFYTNFWLSIVTIVVAPIMAKIGTTIASRSRKRFTRQQAELGKVNAYIEEIVTGQKVVKVFCHEDKVIDEFETLNDSLKNAQIKAQFAGGMMGPSMNAMSQVNYTLTAGVGSILVILGRLGKFGGLDKNGLFSALDIGGLTVFVNFSRQFSRPINELAQQLTVVMSALAGAERVFDVMDQVPELDEGKRLELKDVKGDVVLENVTFGYNPDKTILKNVSIYAHGARVRRYGQRA